LKLYDIRRYYRRKEMKREIIHIDEDKCTGCGLCIPNCPEGALQIIDGKARLISDLFCDGLGACVGHCPEDAITVEVREAEPYDERKVMENIVKAGPNTIVAHLKHLKEHGEEGFLKEAMQVLNEKNIEVDLSELAPAAHSGCPGARAMALNRDNGENVNEEGKRPSELTHWPIQLHLIPPMAPHFKGTDVLLSADCVAHAYGDFHKDLLKDRTLTIACPKLDQGQDIYVDKLTALIDHAEINSLTVAIMEVPCCRGLLMVAQKAAAQAERKIPINLKVMSIGGEILQEEEITAAVV
jgi:ferredoxin